MRKSAEKPGVRSLGLTLLPLLVAWGCDGEPLDQDHDARDEEVAQDHDEVDPASRPLRLEDPEDVRRRAELAIDARIAARPGDAVHREALVRWKAEQILLDDMSEAAPLEDRYGFSAAGVRTQPTDSHEHQEEGAP